MLDWHKEANSSVSNISEIYVKNVHVTLEKTNKASSNESCNNACASFSTGIIIIA